MRVVDLADHRAVHAALEEQRQKLGFAISDWSDRSGCSITGLFAWRAAQRSPGVFAFAAAAEALGFSLWMVSPYGMPKRFNAERPIAEEIARQRKRQRMTLEKLAAASTVSASTILAICSGSRGTQVGTMLKLTTPLGIRLVMRLGDLGVDHTGQGTLKPATEYPI